MPKTLEPIKDISVGATRVVSIDLGNELDKDANGNVDVLLTGTPSVTLIGPSGLTLENKAINTAILWLLNKSCPVATVVQFKVSSHLLGKIYRVRISCATDATVAETIVVDVRLRGV